MIDFKIINSYLEIRTLTHIKKLVEYKKKYSFLKKYKGKKILLIDKSPNYNNFNISQIIFLFSQIGQIDLYYNLITVSDVDKEMSYLIDGKTKLIGEDAEYFFKYLREFNTYKTLIKIFDKSIKIFDEHLHNNIEYDLVICNGRGFIKDYENTLKKIKYKNIFYFYKRDIGGLFLEYPYLAKNKSFIRYFKNIFNYENKILNFKNSFDTFNNGGYIFFSTILSELYRFTNYPDKKYDIVIAGSFRARDFYLVNKLLELRNLKVLVITETGEDVRKIKQTLSDKHVDIVINSFSYYNMYKLVSLGKMYLNCSKYGSFSNGVTGMLVPCTSETIVVSYRNPFFTKVIEDGYDGFLYSNLEELLNKVDYILSLDYKTYTKVCKNRLKTFYNGVTIENILIKKVFSKLLK